jgi:ElaB/YqjD/DUF883 family membrane-anchored ribosome-binding protein
MTIPNTELNTNTRNSNLASDKIDRTSDKLVDRASDVADSLASQARSVSNKFQGRIEDARGWFQGIKNQTQEEFLPAAERSVRENPMKALLISAAIGMILGMIFRPARD